MPITSDIIARLHAEAARCERIALGVSDSELIGRLTDWAREYRRDAGRLSASVPSRLAV